MLAVKSRKAAVKALDKEIRKRYHGDIIAVYLTEVVMMLAMWASPIVYSWSMVQSALERYHLPNWILEIYAANPLTIGVLGFHRAFWGAGTEADYPAHLALRMFIAAVIGVLLLWFAHRVFNRMQGNFAQEL